MSAEKFKITTRSRDRSRVFFWDSSTPCYIQPSKDWILEKSDQGIRARYLGGKANLIVPNSSILIPDHSIQVGQPGSPISLREPQSEEIQIQLESLVPIPPAYLKPSPSADQPRAQKKKLSHRILWSGKRGHSLRTHFAAYVAYVRRNPIFTLFTERKKTLINTK
jgi:hypothetical protein